MVSRQDDAFGRKVIGSLIVTLLLQLGGWMYSVGILANKIQSNTDDIHTINMQIEALRKVNDRLIRIEVLMEAAIVGNNKISENQAIFGAEQQRQGPIINEAIRHVRNNDLHAENK